MTHIEKRLTEIGMMTKFVEKPRLGLPSEHAEQCALIDWWAYACKSWGIPEKMLFAIPNAGAGASKGQAGKMKGEGARPGIPDLMLAIPRAGFHGLFIEMKNQKGLVRSDQKAVHEMLVLAGYQVRVCRGFEEGKAAIGEYLGCLRFVPFKL